MKKRDGESCGRAHLAQWQFACVGLAVLTVGALIRRVGRSALFRALAALPILMFGLAVSHATSAAAASTSRQTLYVRSGATGLACTDPSQTGACPSVTDALDVATSGATINVGSGVFTDHMVVPGGLTGLTITGSTLGGSTTISGNQSGTVIKVTGGASVTLKNLSLTNGIATPGTYAGGVYNQYGATATLIDDTVSGNSDSGLQNYGTILLTHDTVSGNTGTGFYNDANATLTDDTFSGNSADQNGRSGNGGAIQNGGNLTMISDTVAENTAGLQGGEIYNYDALTMAGTIVGPNTGSSGPVAACANITNPDPTAAIADDGFNIDPDNSCFLTSRTSHPGANGDLGGLQDNGGPTLTMAPGPGSPELDAIPVNTTLGDITLCPGVDQRGVQRPQGPGCDIGAVELAPDVSGGIQKLSSDLLNASPDQFSPASFQGLLESEVLAASRAVNSGSLCTAEPTLRKVRAAIDASLSYPTLTAQRSSAARSQAMVQSLAATLDADALSAEALLLSSPSTEACGGATSAPSNIGPKTSVISSDNQQITLQMALPVASFGAQVGDQNNYVEMSQSGAYSPGKDPIGSPEVPSSGVNIAVPAGACVKVSTIAKSSYQLKGVLLWPVQPPIPLASPPNRLPHGPNPTFTINTTAYTTKGSGSTPPVVVSPTESTHGLSVASLTLGDAQYVPIARSLRVFTSIELRVRFACKNSGTFASSSLVQPSDLFQPFLAAAVVNYSTVSQYLAGPEVATIKGSRVSGTLAANSQCGYNALIFTSPDLAAAATQLENDLSNVGPRQGSIGAAVYIVGSASGQVQPTATAVRNVIASYYQNCSVQPSYVVILGDTSKVPTFEISLQNQGYPGGGYYEDPVATDMPYAFLTPDKVAAVDSDNITDFWPDAAVGRIPAQNEAQAMAAVNAIQGENAGLTGWSNITLAEDFQPCPDPECPTLTATGSVGGSAGQNVLTVPSITSDSYVFPGWIVTDSQHRLRIDTQVQSIDPNNHTVTLTKLPYLTVSGDTFTFAENPDGKAHWFPYSDELLAQAAKNTFVNNGNGFVINRVANDEAGFDPQVEPPYCYATCINPAFPGGMDNNDGVVHPVPSQITSFNGGEGEIAYYVNKGSSLLAQFDHGEDQAWFMPGAGPALAMTVADVNQLSPPAGELPVVVGFDCDAGKLDSTTLSSASFPNVTEGGSPSLGEAWIEDTKAVAYIGSSRVSLLDNDRMMFQDFASKSFGYERDIEFPLGQMLNLMKTDFLAAAGTGSFYNQEALLEYNDLGDPSMVPSYDTGGYL